MFDRLKRWLTSRRPASPKPAPISERPVADPWERLAQQRRLSLDAQLDIANGRLTEQQVQSVVREGIKRFRETASNNPASLWALSFVDPYDWAMDTPDFYPGFGALGGWGVPWMLNNQGRGDVLPVYINEYGLKLIRDWSRKILAFNEFAINAVENRISYVVGKGFQYTVLPKQQSITPAQAIGNESGAEPSSLAAKAQAVLDEFISRERWNEREQECVRRCDRDGEAFLRFFHRGQGRTSVRFVEPECVTDGKGRTSTLYGVITDPEDIESVQAYSIVENPGAGEWIPDPVPAKDVLHIKANTDFDAKRGLPTLFPVRKNLERADKLLRNMSIMGQVQATFAVIRKHKSFAPSSVQAYQQNAADMTVAAPISGNTQYLKQLYAGSIIDTSDRTSYEFPSANIDASGLVAVLQAELRAIAARLVMPEWMLTIDASNGNFSGQFIAEAPSSKKFERDQAWFARRFGDGEYGRADMGGGVVVGALWRVLAIAVEAGLLPPETLTDLEIQVEGPSLVVRNKAAETNRAKTLSEVGILSDETWAKWEGLDYKQEQALGAKPKAPAPSPFGGGPGGGVQPSAPPGAAMGESILREDEGRWITIGGKESKDGKRHGGSPVFIKDGRIVKGAPSLAGKKIDALKGPAADSTHRKDLNREKDYQRAVWGKKARKAGHRPEHLHQLAGEIAAHDKAHVEQRKKLLRDARDYLKANGYDPGALTTNLRRGRVEDAIPHLDELSDSMAKLYPDQFAGHDPEERMLELLTSGNPEAMDTDSAYQQAFDQLDAMKASEPASGDEEDFPFGANAADDDAEDFPFGANAADDDAEPVKPGKAEPVKLPPGAEELATDSQQSPEEWAFGDAQVDDPDNSEDVRRVVADKLSRGVRLPRSVLAAHPDLVKAHLATLADAKQRGIKPAMMPKVNAAQKRWENREQHAKGGGLFGGEDLQARAGFAKLPDGAGVLFTDGEFAGQTGKIVHDFDPLTGKPRIMAQVEGRPGLLPISPEAIEPLDAHLSWRTDTASAPSKQAGLFTADQFLPKRNRESLAALAEEIKHVFGKCIDTDSHKVVPCPQSGADAKGGEPKSKEEKEKQLAGDVEKMQSSAEGRETLARGAKLAGKVKDGIGAGVKAAIGVLDGDSLGGASYLLHSIKKLDAGGALAGAHAVVRSIFTNVYEEIFELALSQHSMPGAHAVGVIGAKVAVKIETGIVKAIAWAWKKATAREAVDMLLFEGEPQWTNADRQFAHALANIGGEAIRTVLKAAGVNPEDVDIDETALGKKIIGSLLAAK